MKEIILQCDREPNARFQSQLITLNAKFLMHQEQIISDLGLDEKLTTEGLNATRSGHISLQNAITLSKLPPHLQALGLAAAKSLIPVEFGAIEKEIRDYERNRMKPGPKTKAKAKTKTKAKAKAKAKAKPGPKA